MMSLNFADHIAAAMTEVRRNWQVPGCRRMLVDYAHEATTVPIGEIGAAALLFAQNPAVQVPSLELFRAGPHWRNSVEHERTLRPADRPRCTIHAPETLPCRWCESERKAAENPAAPVVMVDDEQRQMNARWVEKIRAAHNVERAGTGAGEAADPDSSEATAGVTRSADRPEAPAQARPLGNGIHLDAEVGAAHETHNEDERGMA